MSLVDMNDIVINWDNHLGSGYVSRVFWAFNLNKQKKWAAKIIELKKIVKEDLIAINREVLIQKSLTHANIVKLKGIYQSDEELIIFLEFLENGSLFGLMQKMSPSLGFIKRVFEQVVTAVAFIHSKGYVHRDIKPENILFDSDFNAKLCDFGFCAPYGNHHRRNTACGTFEYLAPEILLKQEQSDKVDIWCLGVLLYEMIHWKTPFKDMTNEQKIQAQEQREYWFRQDISNNLKELILDCL